MCHYDGQRLAALRVHSNERRPRARLIDISADLSTKDQKQYDKAMSHSSQLQSIAS